MYTFLPKPQDDGSHHNEAEYAFHVEFLPRQGEIFAGIIHLPSDCDSVQARTNSHTEMC